MVLTDGLRLRVRRARRGDCASDVRRPAAYLGRLERRVRRRVSHVVRAHRRSLDLISRNEALSDWSPEDSFLSF